MQCKIRDYVHFDLILIISKIKKQHELKVLPFRTNNYYIEKERIKYTYLYVKIEKYKKRVVLIKTEAFKKEAENKKQ